MRETKRIWHWKHIDQAIMNYLNTPPCWRGAHVHEWEKTYDQDNGIMDGVRCDRCGMVKSARLEDNK